MQKGHMELGVIPKNWGFSEVIGVDVKEHLEPLGLQYPGGLTLWDIRVHFGTSAAVGLTIQSSPKKEKEKGKGKGKGKGKRKENKKESGGLL